MSVTRELERLVIRLMGDASHYEKTLAKTIDNTEKFARLQEDNDKRTRAIRSVTNKKIADMEEIHQRKLNAMRTKYAKEHAALIDPNRINKANAAYNAKQLNALQTHAQQMFNMQAAHQIRLNRVVNPQTRQRMIDDFNERMDAKDRLYNLRRIQRETAHQKNLQELNDPNRLINLRKETLDRMRALQDAHDLRIQQMQGVSGARIARINAAHHRRMDRLRIDALAKEKADIAKAAAENAQQIQDSARAIGVGLSIAGIVVGAYSVKKFAEFNKGLIESIAIFRDTTNNFAMISKETENKLEAKALSVSAATIHSAKDLAATYYEFASSGRSAEEAMSSLLTVSRFATAGAFDLKTASNLLLRAQNALGLYRDTGNVGKDAAANAGQMNRLANALVAGSNISQATVEELAQSLTNHFGASLRVVNKSLEEGIALLTVYSKEQQGLIAGSTGSRMIRLLGTPANTAAAAKRRKELGFNVFDDTGSMKHFADIVKNLEDILGGMSDELKLATLEELGFEARIQHAILPLIGFSAQIRKNHDAILAQKNVMEEMAQKQMEAFSNQMQVLKNKIDVVAIGLGKALVPAIKSVAGEIEILIKWWNELGITMTKNKDGSLTVTTNGLRNFASHLVSIAAMTVPIYLMVRAIGALVTITLALKAAALGAGTAMMSWRVPMVLAAAAIIELGKALNEYRMKDLVKGIDASNDYEKERAITYEKSRREGMKGIEGIKDLEERKKALLEQSKKEKALLKEQEDEVNDLTNQVKKAQPKLPSIMGLQLELRQRSVGALLGALPTMGLSLISDDIADFIGEQTTDLNESVHNWTRLKSELEQAAKRLGATQAQIAELGTKLEDVDKIMQEAVEGRKQQVNELGSSIDAFVRTVERETKIVGMSTEQQKLWTFEQDAAYFATERAGMGLGEFVRVAGVFAKLNLAKKFIEITEATKKSNKAIEEFTEALTKSKDESREFWSTLDMDEPAKKVYELEQLAVKANKALEIFYTKSGVDSLAKMFGVTTPKMGLSPEEKEMFGDDANLRKRHEHFKKLMETGKDLTKDMLDPQQKFQARFIELNEIINAGAIGWVTYIRAVDEAAEAVKKLENGQKSLSAAVQQSAVGSAESITRMNDYLDAISGGGARAPRDFFNPMPKNPLQGFRGLFPENRLPMRGRDEEYGNPLNLFNKLFPQFELSSDPKFAPEKWKTGPTFQQNDWKPTNTNRTDVDNKTLGENSPIHRVLVDIRTALTKTDKSRPVVEIETADIS